MVQHREGHDGAETRRLEWHGGGVTGHHFDAAAGGPSLEGFGQACIDLDSGDARHQAAEHIGGQPGPRADLQHIIAQFDSVQHPTATTCPARWRATARCGSTSGEAGSRCITPGAAVPGLAGIARCGAIADVLAGGAIDVSGDVALVPVAGRRRPRRLKHQDRAAG